MKKYLLFSLVVIGLISCQKDEDKDKDENEIIEAKNLWGGISETEYYENEILDNNNIDLYGKWKMEKTDGGLSGMGYEIDFELLEFRKYGLYGIIRNDSLIEYGKIEVKEQSEEKLWVLLHRNENSVYIFPEYEIYLELPKEDSLNILSASIDGYNHYFSRIE